MTSTITLTHQVANRTFSLPLLTAEERAAHIAELEVDLAKAEYWYEQTTARAIRSELSLWKRFGPWVTPAN